MYPDMKSSVLWNGDSNGLNHLTRVTGHFPWLTVLVIDLPNELPAGTTGDGIIEVTTTAEYGAAEFDINTKDIHFTVLPGVGEHHKLEYYGSDTWIRAGSLDVLEKSHCIEVETTNTGTAPNTRFAAAEFRLQFPEGDAPGPDSYYIIAENLEYMTYSRAQLSWRSDGPNDDIVVTFMSPTGELVPLEMQFSILFWPIRPVSQDAPRFMPSQSPNMESVVYYDVNGDVTTGPEVSEYNISLTSPQ